MQNRQEQSSAASPVVVGLGKHEQTTSVVPKPSAPVAGSVRVIHGATNKYINNLAGKKVGYVRDKLKELFSIPKDSDAFVGTQKVDDEYVLMDNQSLEFSRQSGEKGMIRRNFLSFFALSIFRPKVENEDIFVGKHGDDSYHYKNGELFFSEETNGTKKYYKNGLPHREDGPAVEHANGDKYWYLNGKLHRENGPAIEFADGKYKAYWVDGVYKANWNVTI